MSGALMRAIGDHLQTIAAVPVELRQTDATLIAETSIGALFAGDVKIPGQGKYLASVRLPTGFQLTLPVEIEANGSLGSGALNDLVQGSMPTLVQAIKTGSASLLSPLVSSAIASLQQNAPAMAAFVNSLTGSQSATRATPDPQPMALGAVPDLAGWKAQAWVGTPLRRELAALQPAVLPASGIDGGLLVATDQNAQRPVTVHLTPPAGEPFNYIVPPGTSITTAADGTAFFDVGEPSMNSVLRRRAAGEIVSDALVKLIDGDFITKCRNHPGAALTAAYTVLRTAQSKDAKVSAMEALNQFPVMSDILVLRAELAARQGRHAEALELFVQACDLDLPSFTSGLGYLVDRLRFYVRLGESDRNLSKLPSNGPRDASDALAAVQPYAVESDFTAPFVVYRGLAAVSAVDLEKESSTSTMQQGGG